MPHADSEDSDLTMLQLINTDQLTELDNAETLTALFKSLTALFDSFRIRRAALFGPQTAEFSLYLPLRGGGEELEEAVRGALRSGVHPLIREALAGSDPQRLDLRVTVSGNEVAGMRALAEAYMLMGVSASYLVPLVAHNGRRLTLEVARAGESMQPDELRILQRILGELPNRLPGILLHAGE